MNQICLTSEGENSPPGLIFSPPPPHRVSGGVESQAMAAGLSTVGSVWRVLGGGSLV